MYTFHSLLEFHPLELSLLSIPMICLRKCLLFGLYDIKDSMCTNDAIGMNQAETMVYLLGSIFLILVRASYIRGGADRIDELR
ncbi:hypothetical protein V1478_015419 [Vespula squamosa]|uniref:Uncharacterized protein n=1 Tax=Vespula squamosa TaxID=30214 RepID=A0ABD2A549_VESSQ